MDSTIYLVTLVGTLLVLAAAFSSLIAFRFGAPLLLLFLGIGLGSGVDGLGIVFDNANLAYFVSALALAVILFESGFGTPLSMLRQAAAPALTLATLGVLLTTGLFATAAHILTDLDWIESLLLGAAVASTDAAAVFFLLRAGNINLRERLRSTLEIESGTNDPIAIFLTILLVGVIARRETPDIGDLSIELAVGFVEHMGIGGLVGLFGGYGVVRLIERFELDAGLLPIFVLALSMLIFAAAGVLHGSGFLAVYVAGLYIGNSNVRRSSTIKRFQDGLSWLGQIIMFLVLGLYATPSEWLPILPVGIALGLFLALLARPIAVWICLSPFGFSRPETAFVSWVG
ncbi:potassium/proton antiporter, partial [Salmonella enterica subsp. enterica]|nr:potassium/proton antiporter [Salmonella enterica subsp. enterica serovar Enteritidis]